jgi:hypothetical protein
LRRIVHVLPRIGLVASLSLQDVLLNTWWGIRRRGSRTEHKIAFAIYSEVFPWLRSEPKSSLELSPFKDMLSLSDFVKSQNPYSKILSMNAPIKRGLPLPELIIKLVTFSYVNGQNYLFTRPSVKMTDTKQLNNKLLLEVWGPGRSRDSHIDNIKKLIVTEPDIINFEEPGEINALNDSEASLAIIQYFLKKNVNSIRPWQDEAAKSEAKFYSLLDLAKKGLIYTFILEQTKDKRTDKWIGKGIVSGTVEGNPFTLEFINDVATRLVVKDFVKMRASAPTLKRLFNQLRLKTDMSSVSSHINEYRFIPNLAKVRKGTLGVLIDIKPELRVPSIRLSELRVYEFRHQVCLGHVTRSGDDNCVVEYRPSLKFYEPPGGGHTGEFYSAWTSGISLSYRTAAGSLEGLKQQMEKRLDEDKRTPDEILKKEINRLKQLKMWCKESFVLRYAYKTDCFRSWPTRYLEHIDEEISKIALNTTNVTEEDELNEMNAMMMDESYLMDSNFSFGDGDLTILEENTDEILMSKFDPSDQTFDPMLAEQFSYFDFAPGNSSKSLKHLFEIHSFWDDFIEDLSKSEVNFQKIVVSKYKINTIGASQSTIILAWLLDNDNRDAEPDREIPVIYI